ncbi:13750_t:CDS:2 [Entrophospora sp. SA101]|nr:7192_t:CDS:2 [Entrophospora sp. SA101]CAJ0836876.1 4855_t:CDS:2 [Entrophospora sp. SA101]CAJ0908402.1 13750_t:CDS:2 [Entrophospora sp. SA101]
MSFRQRKVWSIANTGTFDNLKLEEDQLPPPPPQHLLIKVTAIGLNFADIFAIFGLYSATPKEKFVPGLEFAGVVEGVGEGLQELEWLGKRVYGATKFGGYATWINQRVEYVKNTPDDWTDQQACAYVVQAMTAYYAIEELGSRKENKVVLVHSAAGGVGSHALSILDKISAKAVGTVGNVEKLDLLNQKYGDNPNFAFILRSPAKTFEKRAREALNKICNSSSDDGGEVGGFDLVLDSVMGEWFWPNYRLMDKEGRLILIGAANFTPTGNLHFLWNVVEWVKLGWKFIWRPKIDPMELGLQQLDLEPPFVGHEFEFEQVIDALKLLQSGKSVGKVVVNVKH